ncbi:cell division protein PerM [Cutibacterium sp. V947]|uniref:cell division protein PerM n=1 Tax=Cutibacterium sp. V947 TaxID=3446480 RepID=UPI003EE1BB7E
MGATGSTSTSARFVVESSKADKPREPRVSWPWPVVVVVAAAVAILAQWLALAGIIVAEWLVSNGQSFPSILAAASSFWLGGHGVPIDIVGIHVGLVPLGLTCVSLLLGEEACRYGTRVLWHRHDGQPPRRHVGEAVALHTTIELLAAIIMTAAAGTSHWVTALVGALLIGLCSGVVGACRGARLNPFNGLPHWARGLPKAVGSTVALCLAGGSTALAVTLLVHASNVVHLHQQIGATGWGGICLILLQLAWLPTMALWGTAWTVGPGFAFGTETFVSPLGTHLGIVPALPVLGALPSSGPLSPAACAWCAVPVASGIIGGILLMKSLPEAGFEIGAGIGALSGLLSGLVLAILGLLSHGSLGDGRLSEVGTIMPATAGCAVGILTLVTMLCGFAIGITRRLQSEESRRRRAERREARKENRAAKSEQRAQARAVQAEDLDADEGATSVGDESSRKDSGSRRITRPAAVSKDPRLVKEEAIGHDIYDSMCNDRESPENEDTTHHS